MLDFFLFGLFFEEFFTGCMFLEVIGLVGGFKDYGIFILYFICYLIVVY